MTQETSNFPLWDLRINRGVLPATFPMEIRWMFCLSIPQAVAITGGGVKGTTLSEFAARTHSRLTEVLNALHSQTLERFCLSLH